MLSFDDVNNIVSKILFKDHALQQWGFRLTPSFIKKGEKFDGCLLNVTFFAQDVDTPGHPDIMQNGRKFYISPYMTESEVVQTAFLAIKVALEHEARESFFYNGKRVFGPHIDVNAHAEIADRIQKRD